MGFPSPAKDHEEDRHTVDKLCGVGMNCRFIETDWGLEVTNIALPVRSVIISYVSSPHSNGVLLIAGMNMGWSSAW